MAVVWLVVFVQCGLPQHTQTTHTYDGRMDGLEWLVLFSLILFYSASYGVRLSHEYMMDVAYAPVACAAMSCHTVSPIHSQAVACGAQLFYGEGALPGRLTCHMDAARVCVSRV